jgi:hypothetical protein
MYLRLSRAEISFGFSGSAFTRPPVGAGLLVLGPSFLGPLLNGEASFFLGLKASPIFVFLV